MRQTELLQLLIDLLIGRSVKFGDFTLASGRKSKWYVDVRLTSMSAFGQRYIGQLGCMALTDAKWAPDFVGGLTLGADPVAYAIAHGSILEGSPIDAFTVRKERKDHGAGKQIEGVESVRGRKVVIIEDVVTTGGSALKAAEAVKAEGGDILGVLAVLDREEGGREAIERAGYHLRSLVTGAQLLARAKEKGLDSPNDDARQHVAQQLS